MSNLEPYLQRIVDEELKKTKKRMLDDAKKDLERYLGPPYPELVGIEGFLRDRGKQDE